MESSSRSVKAMEPQVSLATRQGRSGYEPSDTETDWQESPLHDHAKKNGVEVGFEGLRSKSPLTLRRRQSSIGSHAPRRHSKSPYKPRVDYDNVHLPAPEPRMNLDIRKNVSPLRTVEHRKHLSPYRMRRQGHGFVGDEIVISNGEKINNDQIRAGEKLNYSRRATSAPRPRLIGNGLQITYDDKKLERVDRKPGALPKNLSQNERETSNKHEPSVGEINEMVANAKISREQENPSMFESMESISPGDIFFSREYAAPTMQKVVFLRDGGVESQFSAKPEAPSNRYQGPSKGDKSSASFSQQHQGISSSTVMSQTAANSISAVSRQSSNISDSSGRTSASARKFVANRLKSQSETWFSCIKTGSCRNSKKSPEKERAFDETSFIQKAFVIDSLRQFWADKHQPASLNGFACHKQEALLLKQLVSQQEFPHILLKGPPGSGKKAMTMAFLREIYGESAWNISHDLRHFHIQDTRPVHALVPVSSSPHHVELNVFLEPNARYAMMAMVKQISNEYAVTPEISNAYMKADYKVMVLYDVDKSAESVQHLIKWIMDCYSDACKLILCCGDDVDILEPVTSRCRVVKLDPPVTHEIMEVLIQIARKEEFELGMSFAAKIATKSKQNMRRAIMALEACKAHNYPFVDDQPIPLGWEEVLMELADEILADPYPRRSVYPNYGRLAKDNNLDLVKATAIILLILFMVRGKLQKLLQEFVHPKLILLKLVEQFLKRVDSGLKREIHYWNAYYDKRLPPGTSSLLKLEEFVAKFMSIYRKSSSNLQLS